jgi:hypothetical protein
MEWTFFHAEVILKVAASLIFVVSSRCAAIFFTAWK